MIEARDLDRDILLIWFSINAPRSRLAYEYTLRVRRWRFSGKA